MNNKRKKPTLPATVSGPNPGDFPLGSPESRAASRAMLERRNITSVMVMTGLPSSFSGPPTVSPPDTVEYYVAPDDSIVRVICREYERGKFTAFIDQTWENGSVYQGDYMVKELADLQKLCRPQALAGTSVE